MKMGVDLCFVAPRYTPRHIENLLLRNTERERWKDINGSSERKWREREMESKIDLL